MDGEEGKGMDRRGQEGRRVEESREGRKASGEEKWWTWEGEEVIMAMLVMVAVVETAVRWSMSVSQTWDSSQAS